MRSRFPLLLTATLCGLLSCHRPQAARVLSPPGVAETRSRPTPSPRQTNNKSAPQHATESPPVPVVEWSSPIGDSGPLALEAADPDGRWVVYCQAPRNAAGDAKTPQTYPRFETRLARVNQPERVIDTYLGSDASGRYLVYQHQQQVWLLDTQTESSLSLDQLAADLRLDALPYQNARIFSFDAQGKRGAYIKKRGATPVVVVRELESGSEREYALGAGEIWRVAFAPDSPFLIVSVLSEDTNHNGRLDWPAAGTARKSACEQPLPRFSDWSNTSDKPRNIYISLPDGAQYSGSAIVAVLGNLLVTREADSSLLLKSKKAVTTLTSAACSARIVHTDSLRQALVYGCADSKRKQKLKLALRSPAGNQTLGIELTEPFGERDLAGSPRLIPLFPEGPPVLFDLARKQVRALNAGAHILATLENQALILKNRQVSLLDADSGSEILLGELPNSARSALLQLPIVYLSPQVFDLKRKRQLGTFSKRPLALSRSGYGLIASQEASAADLALGPLHWEAASELSEP